MAASRRSGSVSPPTKKRSNAVPLRLRQLPGSFDELVEAMHRANPEVPRRVLGDSSDPVIAQGERVERIVPDADEGLSSAVEPVDSAGGPKAQTTSFLST